MSFRISKRIYNGIDLIDLENEKSGVRVSIAPDFGAILHAFEIPLGGTPYNIISNYASLEELQSGLNQSYRSSKLSPFACRIKDARYLFEGKEYTFDNKFPDGSAIHGLLFNKKFTLTRQTVTEFMASIELNYTYNAEDAGYPFNYTCTVRYSLLPDATLQIQTELSNTSACNIPIADGWHPYFTLGGSADEWTLQFNSSRQLEYDADLLPTGNQLTDTRFEKGALLKGIELDNSFELEGDTAFCMLSNAKWQLRISPDKHYPILQIYIPPKRNSIAIENLSGAPDNFNNQIHLLHIAPGEERSFTTSYTVKAL